MCFSSNFYVLAQNKHYQSNQIPFIGIQNITSQLLILLSTVIDLLKVGTNVSECAIS